MIAGGGEPTQVTLAKPYHPVRLHEHRLVPGLFREAKAQFAMVQRELVRGSHNIDYRKAELRAEKLREFIELQAKLSCSDKSPLDFRQGIPFGDHQRLAQHRLQFELLRCALSRFRQQAQHVQTSLRQHAGFLKSEYF